MFKTQVVSCLGTHLCKMTLLTSVLLAWLSWASLHTGARAEMCRGAHCFGGDAGDPGSRTSKLPRNLNPAAQRRPAQTGGQNHHAHRAATNPSVQLRARSGDGGAQARTPEECVDVECAAAGKHFQPSSDTGDCAGIECRLPLRIRPPARGRTCVGQGCPAVSQGTVSSAAAQPVFMSDKAAQFLGDVPEFGHASSELGGAPLGVQLTCDIKPGVLCLLCEHSRCSSRCQSL